LVFPATRAAIFSSN